PLFLAPAPPRSRLLPSTPLFRSLVRVGCPGRHAPVGQDMGEIGPWLLSDIGEIPADVPAPLAVGHHRVHPAADARIARQWRDGIDRKSTRLTPVTRSSRMPSSA